jgi:integrase
MRKPEPGVRKDTQRGTWLYVLDVPGARGKRRQEKRRGFASMDEANEAIRARRRELDDGVVVAPDDDSVDAFAKAWIAALPAEGLEAATVKFYREGLGRLLPTIGTIRLQDLSALDLDGAYGALRELGRSARTVQASHVTVKKMLTEAKRIGKVGGNVAEDARPPRAKAARARTFPTWTLEQLETFLAAVADLEHATLWTFAGYTGMRLGELLALRWDDVDLDDAAVTVCRSLGRGADGVHDKGPKSDAGRRTVEIDAPLVDLLRVHRKAQNERRLLLGAGWRDRALVFCMVDGSCINPTTASKTWAATVRRHAPKLKLPVIRFHDLRHSHATQLLDAGVRPDVVTERLGHSTVAFTLQRYGHRYAGDQRTGLARLRELAR